MRAGFLAVGLVGLGCFSACLAACDENREKDLVSKVGEASAPSTSSSAGASASAAPMAVADAAPARKTYTCGRGPDVDFHGNTALEAEVRKKLGKDGGTINQSDLKTIKSINLTQVTSLDDLDPCIFPLFTGMKDLFLGPGELDDLSPIANLTQLVSLRASINKVSDLKPLAKLTQMDRLDLGRTAVHDITPLASMAALTELQLDDTQVTDISPLKNCKNLEKLSIRHTPVTDISPLKDAKKLRFLYIEGAPIADTNVLNSISGLRIVRKGS